MVDQNTEKKVGLNFARLLVEVGMDAKLQDTVVFRNEKGYLIEQKVLYDWRPTLCKFCHQYGHDIAKCRKKNYVTENKIMGEQDEVVQLKQGIDPTKTQKERLGAEEQTKKPHVGK